MSRDRVFPVVLESDPQGGFTAFVPTLPSIVTQAETVEDALARAREAIELTLEDMAADGEPIPEPDRDVRIEHVTVVIDPLVTALSLAPQDEESVSSSDRAGIAEGRTELARGDVTDLGA